MDTATITRDVGTHTLVATAATQFAPIVEDVLGVLEGQTEHLRDGYVLQFGWGPIFLRAEEGALRLSTPDYRGNAADDRTDDLTAAIATQVSQRWLPDAANVAPAEVRFDQEALILRGWEDLEDFEASRGVSRIEIYSGWFICSTEERDEPYPREDILKVPLWQVVQRQPQLAQVLAMPPDTLTILLDGAVDRVVALTDEPHWLYLNPDTA